MIVETRVTSRRKRNIKYGSVAMLLPIFIYFFLSVVQTTVIEEFNIKTDILKHLMNVTLIISISILLILVISVLKSGGFFKHKNILLALKYFQLKNDIDRTFINTNVYNKVRSISDNETLADTPAIEFVDEYTIKIENLSGTTEKLKNFKSHLSSALKDSLICETFELNMTQDYFIAKLIDLNLNNQKLIENHQDFIDYIKDTEAYQIKIMNNFVKDVSKAPHLLISGETGSGKSYLLYFIMFQLILKECELYVIDRKKVLTKFEGILGAEHVADEEEKIFELLHRVNSSMDQREEFFKNEYAEDLDKDFTTTDFKPIFLIIDELGSLVSELESKKQKEFNKMLQSIAQRGRASGVNIIISMQQPNAQNLPTAIRDQLTFKTVLGNTDDTTRNLVFTASDLIDLNFDKGQGYFTNSGTHNKASILFVPTFKFNLDIQNLKQLIELYKHQTDK